MTVTQINIQSLVYFSCLSQIALAIGSLAVPRALNWKVELAKTRPLIGQMFWVYAAYIFVINICFGVISVLAAKDLINHSHLALALTGFIALYWISRVLIQFLYFDRAHFPKGNWYMTGELTLVALFIFLSVVYCTAFYVNFMHIQS
jgi:hypothetical protein